jgi:hypothetical protein
LETSGFRPPAAGYADAVTDREAKEGPEQRDPGDRSKDPEPHHALNNPVGEPDPTEYPDPYETREDPRDPPDPDEESFGEEPHSPTGAQSTSEPHPQQDPAAQPSEGPKRDKLDE